uniref:Uncharacterized protein n=1 Tax=Rhizophora mucronata TaxID=61149 RepID=A0A2P2M120_RHIMU
MHFNLQGRELWTLVLCRLKAAEGRLLLN